MPERTSWLMPEHQRYARAVCLKGSSLCVGEGAEGDGEGDVSGGGCLPAEGPLVGGAVGDDEGVAWVLGGAWALIACERPERLVAQRLVEGV